MKKTFQIEILNAAGFPHFRTDWIDSHAHAGLLAQELAGFYGRDSVIVWTRQMQGERLSSLGKKSASAFLGAL